MRFLPFARFPDNNNSDRSDQYTMVTIVICKDNMLSSSSNSHAYRIITIIYYVRCVALSISVECIRRTVGRSVELHVLVITQYNIIIHSKL